jgi:hypothetical protein
MAALFLRIGDSTRGASIMEGWEKTELAVRILNVMRQILY